MRAIIIAWAATSALLGSALYAFYRQHGAQVWLALALLAVLMALQGALLRVTRGNVLEESILAREPFVRLVFPLLAGFGLWLDVLAPRWYMDGNLFAIAAFALPAVYLAVVLTGVAMIVIALLRHRVH